MIKLMYPVQRLGMYESGRVLYCKLTDVTKLHFSERGRVPYYIRRYMLYSARLEDERWKIG